jgi:hypothetical protein
MQVILNSLVSYQVGLQPVQHGECAWVGLLDLQLQQYQQHGWLLLQSKLSLFISLSNQTIFLNKVSNTKFPINEIGVTFGDHNPCNIIR